MSVLESIHLISRFKVIDDNSTKEKFDIKLRGDFNKSYGNITVDCDMLVDFCNKKYSVKINSMLSSTGGDLGTVELSFNSPIKIMNYLKILSESSVYDKEENLVYDNCHKIFNKLYEDKAQEILNS